MKTKQLFKVLFLSIMIVLIAAVGFAAKNVLTSEWAAAPQKIDGVSTDWEGLQMYTEKKVEADIGFRNDEKYLYILFTFNNLKNLSSLQGTGMTIYFNKDGKKKKNIGINFLTKSIPPDEFIAMYEKQQGPLTEEQKTQFRGQKAFTVYEYEIKSKKSEENLAVATGEGIRPAVFRLKNEQKKVVYEFAVPLEKAVDMAPGVGANPGDALMIGFEWGGWTHETKAAAAARMGAQGNQAGMSAGGSDFTGDTGGAVGGAGGGLPREQLQQMRRMMPKEYIFWYDVQLAVQK
ncbi:MAG: hypothetical protein MUP70_02475 [Candidatus Aminicenantes bacterium]|nr:hypothetical protein [Candidatus Aminicenantes bacterium]